MLRFAVEAINNQEAEQKLNIEEMHAEVPYGNEYFASRRLCRFLKVNVILLISLCTYIKEAYLWSFKKVGNIFASFICKPASVMK